MLLSAGLSALGGFYLLKRGTDVYLQHRRNYHLGLDKKAPGKRNLRKLQLKAVTSGTTEDIQKQHAIDKNLVIATASTLSAAAGAVLLSPTLALLSTVGIAYVGKNALVDAYHLLRDKRKLGIDALLNVTAGLLLFKTQVFVCSAIMLVYAANRKFLAEVKGQSSQSVIDSFKLFPHKAFVLLQPADPSAEPVEVERDLPEIQVGDIVVVNPGEMIPVDGVIKFGQALVDQQRLNGEQQPAELGPGSLVYALTVVISGRIGIRTERTGGTTTASQIAEILANTVEHKTDMQLRAESIMNKTVAPTLLVGAVFSPLIGLTATAAFLSSHPRYKPILATSIGLLQALNQASENGILIRDGRTFDLITQVDTVVFDKTGTLTLEQPEVAHIHPYKGYDKNTILMLAAAAEQRHPHPVAQAIVQAANAQGLDIPKVGSPDYQMGLGLQVEYVGKALLVGSLRYMRQSIAAFPADLAGLEESCHRDGHTLIGVALDGQLIGLLQLQAQVRPEAASIITGLRERGIQNIYILSGDHAAPTAYLAGQLGIDTYFAETLPEQKAQIIEQLQNQGKSVCYVGDGINDAIALKKAHVSVSLSGASSIAMDSAQVILMDKTLSQLCTFIDLAQASKKSIRTSFGIIVIPNAITAVATLFILNNPLLIALAVNMGALSASIAHAKRPLVLKPPLAAKQLPNGNRQATCLDTLWLCRCAGDGMPPAKLRQ